MKQYEIIMADLDGTLISTLSGKTFPEGIWDMCFKWNVIKGLKEAKPNAIYIITNQGGIESGFVDGPNWARKINYICAAIEEYTGVPTSYKVCTSNDKLNPNRKPNCGLVTSAINDYNEKHNTNVDKDNILMIGDASGLDGQFSDSDKKCAENASINYIDVNFFA